MTDYIQVELSYGGKTFLFPYPQKLIVARKFLSFRSETISTPVATAFRPSFDIISVDCLEPLDNPNQDVLWDIFDQIGKNSKVEQYSVLGDIAAGGIQSQPFATLRITYKDQGMFFYYVMPESYNMSYTTSVRGALSTFNFVGCDTLSALNTYTLMGSREMPPITNGKFNI
jgi:hypothetical protein